MLEGGVVKSGWAETLAGRAAPGLGDRPPAPPSGNGSTGLALGGMGHELINVRNSRHEISLSLVEVDRPTFAEVVAMRAAPTVSIQSTFSY